MTTSARSVAHVVDRHRPGLSPAKLDLLLYFMQGHHLVEAGEPLFTEPIRADPEGVRILVGTDAADHRPAPLTNGQAGTVGATLSRYGNLSPDDLRTLIRASTPWQAARKPDHLHIDLAQMSEWFRRPEERNDPDDDRPTDDLIAAFRAKYPAIPQP